MSILVRATRSRGKRRTKSPAKRIERSIRWSALIALVIVGSCVSFCVLRKTIRPFRLYFVEARENSQIERAISRLKKENRTLKAQLPYLRTQAGAETAARALGWVKPGEVSLIVEQREDGEKGKPK